MDESLKAIIFESPLYSSWKNEITVNENGEPKRYTIDYLIDNYSERNELFCTECNAKRVFTPDRTFKDPKPSNSQFGSFLILRNPTFTKSFRCSADITHKIVYNFYILEDKIIKTGQYPSKYDSIKDSFNKYEKILGKEKVTELAKASQLESFGYAIASFLFYRRIYESLIFQTFQRADIKSKISEKEFRELRMEEKVSYLKDYLPQYLLIILICMEY